MAGADNEGGAGEEGRAAVVVSWWWLLVVMWVSAAVGYFIAALMCVSGEQSRLEEMRESWPRREN